MAGGDRRARDPPRARGAVLRAASRGRRRRATTRRKLTTRRAYDLLSRGLRPGLQRSAPARGRGAVAGRRRRGGAPRRRRSHAIPASPRSARSIPSPNGKGVLIQVVAKGSPQDESTTELVHRLARRRRARRDARHRHSTCTSAARPRSASTSPTPLGRRLPYMFLAILLLSFVLLDARVPIAARAAEGRDHEPAVDRRGLRRDRRDLPVGLAQGRRRHRQGRPDRGVGADDAVRDRVRPLDGLRGVPAQPHQGGVRPHPRQRRPPSRTASRRPHGSSPPPPRS